LCTGAGFGLVWRGKWRGGGGNRKHVDVISTSDTRHFAERYEDELLLDGIIVPSTHAHDLPKIPYYMISRVWRESAILK